MSTIHYQRMMQALQLAQDSITRVHPNPKVGCVIYTDDHSCIGMGVTDVLGSDHAEVRALDQFYTWQRHNQASHKKTTRRSKSSRKIDRHDKYHMYVTLEPCAHYGRTPPCVEAIIRAGITHV